MRKAVIGLLLAAVLAVGRSAFAGDILSPAANSPSSLASGNVSEIAPNPSQPANVAPDQIDDIQEYMQSTSQAEGLPPNFYGLPNFSQSFNDTPLGIEVREDCTKLADHERVCGLAVLSVRRNSPAQRAGIRPYRALEHEILSGASLAVSLAAAVFFPPAIVTVGVVGATRIGESFDLIIGVDGQRIRHILDFDDLTANDKPGEVVYLMIVRDGKRVQIPVHIPVLTHTSLVN